MHMYIYEYICMRHICVYHLSGCLVNLPRNSFLLSFGLRGFHVQGVGRAGSALVDALLRTLSPFPAALPSLLPSMPASWSGRRFCLLILHAW